MRPATVGWYDGKNKAAVWLNKGTVRSAFGRKAPQVRVEAYEGFVVLTDMNRRPFRGNSGYYLQE